jgi:cysteine desulfurase
MPKIYLDYAAATPVDSRVLKAMLPFFKDEFANPSSIHAGGVKARQAVDMARSQIAKLIGARPGEVVFTSGATESINLAILGTAKARAGQGRHIVASTIEHKATLKALERDGFEVTFVSVDDRGRVKADEVLAAVRPDTILVTIMLANNEIGTLAPIAEIGRGLLKTRTLDVARQTLSDLAQVNSTNDERRMVPVFHTDAAQAVGVVSVDVEKLHVDVMTFAAAKMYGPKGIGALYVRTGTKLRSVLAGGNQEFGLRPGTENVPGIVGFGVAAEIARTELDTNTKYLKDVREVFVSALGKHCKLARLNGDQDSTVPHIVNVTFPSIDGEELVLRLDALGIACSTAAACQSSDFPSTVLRAIGLSDDQLRSTVRFSFGRSTSLAQAKKAAKIIVKTVDQLSR